LLNVIAGLETPALGSVLVDGSSDRLGRVGYMPWRDLLLPWLDAVGNAASALEVKGTSGVEAKKVAEEVLRQLGLEGFEGARPHELSAGMRQRVAFARTVLASESLLVLDEPFASLDALTRSHLHAWLQDAWPRLGRTGLLVTHDVEEALVLADEVLVLSPRPGRILFRARVPFERPRTPRLFAEPAFVSLRLQVLAALGLASIVESTGV
jgi:ABC-type nitrate/sulfonate/bicarbonate transport system ATPase subunit